MGIRGVFCGGTEMTPQFHRFAVEELLDGVYFAPTYGNTLMGLATHKPPEPEDNYAIIYYPPSPRAMIEVVDPDQPGSARRLWARPGRVRLTTLTREFFMPRFLERDEAEREPPCRQYPWDGVRNVRPFSRFSTTVVEGVYYGSSGLALGIRNPGLISGSRTRANELRVRIPASLTRSPIPIPDDAASPCCTCRSSVTAFHTAASISSASRIIGRASRSSRSARRTPA